MPIGAVIGAATVGAGASIVSGNKAAGATRDAAQQSADVQRYMYDQSRADTANQRAVGDSALNRLAAMYGVSPGGSGGQAGYSSYVDSNPDLAAEYARVGGGFGSKADYGQYHYNTFGQNEGRQAPATGLAGQFGFNASDFQTSPGYAFRRDESMKAIERMGAARGARFSPQTWKAGARYADNLASSEYENYGNALRSMAGIGQTATSQMGSLGVATGQGIANAYTQAGNARASSYANTGAAINNLAGNLAYQGMTGGFGGGNTSPTVQQMMVPNGAGNFYNPNTSFA